MNYKIIGKYIKELKFNIPNPKTFYLLSKEISNYKINVDIKSNRVKQKVIEVQISLGLTPTRSDFEIIDAKITFSTIIEISNEKIEQKEVEKIILINIPSQVYSEIRNIFVSLFENCGFKDVNISKHVDFKKLYEMRKVQ